MRNTIATALTILLLAGSVSAAEIDACKYLLVSDLAEDPYGIVNALRTQGREQGFIIVINPSEVPDADAFKSCLMVGDWLGGVSVGRLAIRVVDTLTGAPIAGATIAGTNWWGIGRTTRLAVAEIYRQLGYSGYQEEAYQARIQRLYPPRPRVSITEADVVQRAVRDHVEGIWTDREDQYRLAIIASPERTGADYIAVVLRSNTPLWQTGEIKAELTRTESPDVFASTYFMLNKQPLATTFRLQGDGILRASISTPAGESEVSLRRVWPPVAPEQAK